MVVRWAVPSRVFPRNSMFGQQPAEISAGVHGMERLEFPVSIS